MANLGRIKLDTEALDKGAWFTHSVGFRFRIRRADYKPYQDALLAAIREARGKAGDDEALSEELIRKAAADCMSRLLVTDWDKVELEDESGVVRPVEFSPSHLAALLQDRAWQDLRSWIEACASESKAYRIRAADQTLGK